MTSDDPMTRLISPRGLVNALDHGKVASRPRAWYGGRSGSVVERRTPEREVKGSNPTTKV